jgi:hypothetical protein
MASVPKKEIPVEDFGVQIVRRGPLEVKEPPFCRWFRSAYSRLGLKWSLVEVEPYVLQHQASILQSIVRGSKAQAVVSILPEPLVHHYNQENPIGESL